MKKIKYIIRIHEIVQRHINYNFFLWTCRNLYRIQVECAYNSLPHTHSRMSCEWVTEYEISININCRDPVNIFRRDRFVAWGLQKNFILVRRKIPKNFQLENMKGNFRACIWAYSFTLLITKIFFPSWDHIFEHLRES